MDNIHLSAKERLIAGISKATSIIKGTYGAAGGNVILEETVYPFHSVRNDGKAILDKVHLEDPIENIGANIVKEAGDKADKESGDGRKTTMLLTEAIFSEAKDCKVLPLDLKRSLDACLPLLTEAIDAQKRPITVNEVHKVATISSENEELGRMVGEIYETIGKDGFIEVENSNLPNTFYEFTEGVRIRNAKFFGTYAATELGKAVWKKPYILVAKDKITSTDQLDPIMKALYAKGVNELVIYFDDIDMTVAGKLAYTHVTGGFKTLLIKAPTLWKDVLFEDMAAVTGATIVDQQTGKSFKSLTVEDLGTCDKISVSTDETRVIGIKDITAHVEKLKSNNDDKSKLRLTWLNTKGAILKVGANSESELSYISKKARDACNASHHALQDGIVPGGGVALRDARHCLPNTVGGRILLAALTKPYEQISTNAGVSQDRYKGVMISKGFGYDVRKDSIVDMFDAGIVDPSIVIKNAVKNAISIASTVLTERGIITLHKPKDETTRQMPGM